MTWAVASSCRTAGRFAGAHPDDAFWIDEITASGAKWGMPDARSFTPDRWLSDGDTVSLYDLEFEYQR